MVIMANKQDLPDALNSTQLADRLRIKQLEVNHKWHIQACCAVSGDGLYEAMKHVGKLSTEYIKRRRSTSI